MIMTNMNAAKHTAPHSLMHLNVSARYAPVLLHKQPSPMEVCADTYDSGTVLLW